MFRLAAVVLVGILIPVHAWADWQYTKWGMTPQQVTAAAAGAAAQLTDAEKARKARNGVPPSLRAPYQANGIAFTAYFYFGAPGGGLSLVALELSNPGERFTLHDLLLAKYGKPVQRQRTAFFTSEKWVDEHSKNVIEYIDLMSIGGADLLYQPGSSSGL